MEIRAASTDDFAAMAAVINPIIEAGGTTAIETAMDAATIAAMTLSAPGHVSTLVAIGADGRVGAFQTLKRASHLPQDVGEIASFSALKGAGRPLMAGTVAAARAAGLAQIDATIRADNAPGLGYYHAMGFRKIGVSAAVPLASGIPVDRIHTRLHL